MLVVVTTMHSSNGMKGRHKMARVFVDSQLNHISAKWRENASLTCQNPSFPEKYINNCRLLFINVSLWNYFIIFVVKI